MYWIKGKYYNDTYKKVNTVEEKIYTNNMGLSKHTLKLDNKEESTSELCKVKKMKQKRDQ